MASSLNLWLDFPNHRKTKRLRKLLGPGGGETIVNLWCYAGTHYRMDGKLKDMTGDEIEEECKWWGEPGKCVAALVKVRFIGQTDAGVFYIINWPFRNKHFKINQERAQKGGQARAEQMRQQREQEFELRKNAAGGIDLANMNGGAQWWQKLMEFLKPLRHGKRFCVLAEKYIVHPDRESCSFFGAVAAQTDDRAKKSIDRYFDQVWKRCRDGNEPMIAEYADKSDSFFNK